MTPAASRHRVSRVTGSSVLQVSQLSLEERRQLSARLLEIYSESMTGLTAETFYDDVFGSEETRIVLFRGEHDELAGFAFTRIDRVEVDGEVCASFTGGVSFRLAYKGGGLETARFGLAQAIRFKLREPRVPLAFVTRASSPAAYRILPLTMPQVFPHPERPTPPLIDRRVRAFAKHRGYRPVGENPWVAASAAVPRAPERFRNLEHDPFARFFLSQNPSYASGSALLVWTRLDVSDIASGLARVSYLRLRSMLTRSKRALEAP